MKHLKDFETNYNYSSMEPFLIEIGLVGKIIRLLKDIFLKYNLEYIDNIEIYDGEYYITLGKYQGNDVPLKYKYTEDDPIEIMIGVPRNDGVDTYRSILKQIENLTENDIENIKVRKVSNKYNL